MQFFHHSGKCFTITDLPEPGDRSIDFGLNMRLQKLIDQIEKEAKPKPSYSFIQFFPDYYNQSVTPITFSKAT